MSLNKIKKIVEGILKGDVEISYPPATNLAIYPEPLNKTEKPKKKRKKLKQVTEEFFNEGLADMYNKYYSAIDNGLFWKLVNLDPTYKGGDIAGNYARWILKLWTTNNLKEEDFYKVTEYLNDFETNKKKFTNKDIFQFKSLPDLYNALQQLPQDTELSSRQQQRELKKQGMKDAKLVFDGSEWQVWIPETYEASCKLGAGTSWCTATTKTRDYYDDYSEEGDLYIIINKKDPTNKYQLHFQSQQYMDKDDREIELVDFLSENKELKDFFQPVIFDLIEEKPSLFVILDNPSTKQVYEGMSSEYSSSFKLENGQIYQFVYFQDLIEDLDYDMKSFLRDVYSDKKNYLMDTIAQNKDVKEFIKKYIAEDPEEPIEKTLYKNSGLRKNINKLCEKYGILDEDTLKEIEEIVSYDRKDIDKDGDVWIPFDFDELSSSYFYDDYLPTPERLLDTNIRYHEIYIDREEKAKLKEIMNKYKESVNIEEDSPFWEELQNILEKYKNAFIDNRNKQQKLKLGHESIKAILRQLDLMENNHIE